MAQRKDGLSRRDQISAQLQAGVLKLSLQTMLKEKNLFCISPFTKAKITAFTQRDERGE